MLKGIKEVYTDFVELNIFIKLVFFIFLLQTLSHIIDKEGVLGSYINQVNVWGVIPVLFLFSIVKSDIFSKWSIPREILNYLFFLIVGALSFIGIIAFDSYLIVLRRVLMTFFLFIIVNHASKLNLKSINIIFLSVFLSSLILCIYLNQYVGINVSIANQNNLESELLSIDDNQGNTNGIASEAVNGIIGLSFLYGNYKKIRIVLLTCLPVFIYIIISCASKSGFINMLSFAFLYYIFVLTGNSRNKILYSVGLGIIIVFAYYYLDDILKGTFLLERFKKLDANYLSEDSRGVLFFTALETFINNPFLGIGLGQYTAFFGVYSHNDFSEVLSTTGIVGAIFYFSVYVLLFYRIQRLLKKSRLTNQETSNIRFCKAVLLTILLRGISLPLFESFEEMFILGSLISYTFYVEKKYLRGSTYAGYRS